MSQASLPSACSASFCRGRTRLHFSRRNFWDFAEGPPTISYSEAQLQQEFQSAVQLLGQRQAQKHLPNSTALRASLGEQQPIKNWIRMNGLSPPSWSAMVRTPLVASASLPRNGPTPPPKKSASSPASLSRQASSSPSQINRSRLRSRIYSNENFEAFGLLCFGVHDWRSGGGKRQRHL